MFKKRYHSTLPSSEILHRMFPCFRFLLSSGAHDRGSLNTNVHEYHPWRHERQLQRIRRPWKFFRILSTIIRSWVDFPWWKFDKSLIQTTENVGMLLSYNYCARVQNLWQNPLNNNWKCCFCASDNNSLAKRSISPLTRKSLNRVDRNCIATSTASSSSICSAFNLSSTFRLFLDGAHLLEDALLFDVFVVLTGPFLYPDCNFAPHYYFQKMCLILVWRVRDNLSFHCFH